MGIMCSLFCCFDGPKETELDLFSRFLIIRMVYSGGCVFE